MLDGVKAGALGEHPAREDPMLFARELDLIDLRICDVLLPEYYADANNRYLMTEYGIS